MPGIDYPQLRRQITMRKVLDLLGFQPTSRHGPQLRGTCPIPGCSSTSDRAFSVHLARQVYHCFACGRRGNALDLWATVCGLPLHLAARELCRALQMEPPWLIPNHLIQPTRPRRVPSRAPSTNRGPGPLPPRKWPPF